MLKRIPDWLIYGFIVLAIYFNAYITARKEHAPQPPPPPELGPLLPLESPRDPSVLVDMGAPVSGIGTAFAIDNEGTWLTARHVVDSCNRVAINIGQGRALTVKSTISQNSDIALLKSDWAREPIASDLYSPRQIGERGFFFGFPQGHPGEVVGTLLGRHRMVIRGRYDTRESILAWTEIGRTRGLEGSLGGLSGGPALDKDGEVVGIVAAESPRRGRIYTVAPRNLQSAIPQDVTATAEAINIDSYGRQADRYRRARRIAQVICLVR
mgnify:FL=1